MSNETPKPGENEGKEIVQQNYAEKLLLAEKAHDALELKFKESEDERKQLADTVSELKAAAQERTFREQLAGVSDIDARVKELAALPVELHEGYIARAKAEITARKQFTERKPVGSDALGSGNGSDAMTQLNAAAAKLRETNPALTPAMAFAEVSRTNPELSRKAYAEQVQA